MSSRSDAEEERRVVDIGWGCSSSSQREQNNNVGQGSVSVRLTNVNGHQLARRTTMRSQGAGRRARRRQRTRTSNDGDDDTFDTNSTSVSKWMKTTQPLVMTRFSQPSLQEKVCLFVVHWAKAKLDHLHTLLLSIVSPTTFKIPNPFNQLH